MPDRSAFFASGRGWLYRENDGSCGTAQVNGLGRFQSLRLPVGTKSTAALALLRRLQKPGLPCFSLAASAEGAGFPFRGLEKFPSLAGRWFRA